MKMFDTSPTVTDPLESARVRLANAESSVKEAKNESRMAKRRRKEAKEIALRAKKRLRSAREELADAERALKAVEEKHARDTRVAARARKKAKGSDAGQKRRATKTRPVSRSVPKPAVAETGTGTDLQTSLESASPPEHKRSFADRLFRSRE